MAKKLTKERIERLLSDVPPEKSFYVCNGSTIKNMQELCSALASMSNEQFCYHRNHKKNDFYNWAKDVVGDIRLANEIARVKTRETTLKKAEQRNNFLRKLLEQNNET